MKWGARITVTRGFLLAACLLLPSCHSSRSDSASVAFTRVPAANAGGPSRFDTIAGRVTGTRPGQQIVLYARSEDLWWVQPFSDHPFTKVQDDSTWKSSTHLGTDYAALLVEPGYNPPETTESLPPVGAGVVATVTVKGLGTAPPVTPPKVLHFSGYDWTVRRAASYRGGSRTQFNPANAWTDERGALHLRIARNDEGWTGAEVKLTHSLGYGTYAFVVRDTTHLEPSAVLTLFTWDDVGTEQNRRELDVEISHWGYRDNDNAHYVVQPYYVPANVFRFRAPKGVLTHAFRWEPGQVSFTTTAGARDTPGARVINQHVFTAGVPAAGGDSARINLYVFAKGEIPLKNENEIVIEKFEYFP